MKNIVSEKIRYSVPMSLWLVVNSQRCAKPRLGVVVVVGACVGRHVLLPLDELGQPWGAGAGTGVTCTVRAMVSSRARDSCVASQPWNAAGETALITIGM